MDLSRTDTEAERGAIVDEPATATTPTPTAAPPVRAPHLIPHRWQPGQSGNPAGRPRESGSLAVALRQVGVKPASTRAELAKLAERLGMNAAEARHIDVIAGLMYDGIAQLLLRTIKGESGAGDKLVGLLTILHKALDGDEHRISLTTPPSLQMAMASVSTVLGFRPEASHALPSANVWHGIEMDHDANDVGVSDDRSLEADTS